MNYAVYPQTVFNIIQSYNGNNGHCRHAGGVPTDYPIDAAAEPASAPFYAPCDMQCVKVYGQVTGISSAANSAWFTSAQPVNFPDGTSDYLTIQFLHMNNADFGKNGIKVGKIYKQYELVGHQGTSGRAEVSHIHISAGKGIVKNAGWVKNSANQWVLQTTGGQFRPEQLLYIDRAFTPVTENTKGIIFKDMPAAVQNKWQPGQSLSLIYRQPIYLGSNDVNPSGAAAGGVVKVQEYAQGRAHPYRIATTGFEHDTTPYQYQIGWVDENALEEWNPKFRSGQLCKCRQTDAYLHTNGGESVHVPQRPAVIAEIRSGLYPFLLYTADKTREKLGWVCAQALDAYNISDVIVCTEHLAGQINLTQDQLALYDIDADGQLTAADVALLTRNIM